MFYRNALLNFYEVRPGFAYLICKEGCGFESHQSPKNVETVAQWQSLNRESYTFTSIVETSLEQGVEWILFLFPFCSQAIIQWYACCCLPIRLILRLSNATTVFWPPQQSSLCTERKQGTMAYSYLFHHQSIFQWLSDWERIKCRLSK
jgi:hypothetical protein